MRYYTVEDIAKMYGTGIYTVHGWINNGRLQREIRFDEVTRRHKAFVSEKELERFMETRPCVCWRFSDISQKIDIVARNKYETAYGICEDISEICGKYRDILSDIMNEEAY